MTEQPGGTSDHPIEIQSFSHELRHPGVVELILRGIWLRGDRGARPPLLLVHRDQDGLTALTSLPSWGEEAPAVVLDGAPWRLRFRCGEHLLAEGTFELCVGQRLIFQLAQPPPVTDEAAPTDTAPVIGTAEGDNAEIDGLVSLVHGLRGPSEVEQRTRMVGALAAQNRDLRARVSDLEEALAQAQDAVSVAMQLQELIGVEASAAQARVNLEDARGALREALFETSRDSTAAELWRAGEQERAARGELAAKLHAVETARADALHALPKPS